MKEVLPVVIPVMTIILDIGAALIYACYGDWKRAIYWTAAAVLTWAVTF